MSQHKYQATAQVEVLMGYDRALDYVFCVVYCGHEPIYSNLTDNAAGTACKDVEYYRPILAHMGIHVPERMFEEVKADQRNRVGNKVVEHTNG